MDQRGRSGTPPGKPGGPPGISAAEAQDLRTRLTALEKQLAELGETNHWNVVLRQWKEGSKIIKVISLSGREIVGRLEWIDRYTIGIRSDKASTEPVIIHKGAIEQILVL